MNGFTNQGIIAGLVSLLTMSCVAFFMWILASIRELRGLIDHLDEKFSAKIEALTIAVSRLEGSDYHAPPDRRSAASDVV